MGGTVYVADKYLVPLLGCKFSKKKSAEAIIERVY